MEGIPSPETREREPEIRLQFFRHDEKAKTPKDADDARVRLTEVGRKNAEKVGEEHDINPEGTVIYGSPRDRSTETAYHRMMGEGGGLQDLALEDLQQRGRNALQGEHPSYPEGKGPKKDAQKDALDFVFSGEFETIANKHYLESKDLLTFVFEESDKLAKELGDTESRTYSRTAAEIAKLIKPYLETVLPRWQTLSKDKKYTNLNGRLERLFASHQTVTESFLLKAVEVAEGREAARNLLGEFKSKNGFDFSEGYNITIKPPKENNEEAVPTIELAYKQHHWNLTQAMLDRIIKEGSLEETPADETK